MSYKLIWSFLISCCLSSINFASSTACFIGFKFDWKIIETSRVRWIALVEIGSCDSQWKESKQNVQNLFYFNVIRSFLFQISLIFVFTSTFHGILSFSFSNSNTISPNIQVVNHSLRHVNIWKHLPVND
jgi:hypothetical protein